MQNQIYRGVQHAAKKESTKQNNSSLTYRGVTHKQDDVVHHVAETNARMNYRGLSYSKTN